ncbi:MAG TPA: LptF/LptG family permease [Gemmatimonadaceae bacterium]|nr:LptF/LptG family permease [Gemmatimonadaceae bacterium]
MKILARYVLKEHVGPLAFSLAALTALLLLQQVAKQFGNLVGKGLSWGVIGEVFLLSLPFIVAMTFPMAVLVAVLYAFSRMAAENEITALRASGVSIVKIVRPVFWASVVLAVVMLGFNDQVLSRSNHRLRTLQTDIGRKKPTFALREQVINEVSPGKLYLRTGHIDQATNRLRDVTIYDFTEPLRPRTVNADSARVGITPNMQDLQMTLYDGYSTTLPRDQPGELQRVFFHKDLIRVAGVGNELQRTTEDSYKGSREMTVCEMQHGHDREAVDYAAAQQALGDAMVDVVQRAVTGRVAQPVREAPRTAAATPDTAAAQPKRRHGLSIGSAYCGMLAQFFGVQEAQAAEVPGSERREEKGERREAGGDGGGGMPLAREQGTRPAGAQRTRPARTQGTLPARARAVRRGLIQGTHVPPAPGMAPAQQPGTSRFHPRRPAISDAVLSASVGRLSIIQQRAQAARHAMSDYEIEIQKKFALAAACVVFVIFGAPIALRFPRGGVGLVIGVSIVVFALYYVGLIGGQALAEALILSPFWSMWLTDILFAVAGILLLVRAQRAGAAGRGGELSEWLAGLRDRVAGRRPRTSHAVESRRGGVA